MQQIDIKASISVLTQHPTQVITDLEAIKRHSFPSVLISIKIKIALTPSKITVNQTPQLNYVTKIQTEKAIKVVQYYNSTKRSRNPQVIGRSERFAQSQ
jgi:hypothetical protein